MSKPNSAAAFLENMKQGTGEEAPPPATPTPTPAKKTKGARRSQNPLKHVGGYFTRETVERIAILRARLDLDNSELIKLAIDELFTKQKAKRAFNDE